MTLLPWKRTFHCTKVIAEGDLVRPVIREKSFFLSSLLFLSFSALFLSICLSSLIMTDYKIHRQFRQIKMNYLISNL